MSLMDGFNFEAGRWLFRAAVVIGLVLLAWVVVKAIIAVGDLYDRFWPSCRAVTRVPDVAGWTLPVFCTRQRGHDGAHSGNGGTVRWDNSKEATK